MRITENTIASGYLYTINQSRERINKLNEQLATGKMVQRPSDDPQEADVILRLTNSKTVREQYAKNALEGQGISEITADSLGNFADVLTNIKEIMIKASNSANAEDLKTYGTQVNELLAEAVNIGNTKFNGKYLFGGTQTSVQPYTLAADGSSVTQNPNGVSGDIKFQVGESIYTKANISGADGLEGTQIFNLMIQVRDSLNDGTFSSDTHLNDVEDALSHVLNASSTAAAFSNSFQAIGANIEGQLNQIDQYLSLHQDTDVAEVTLKMQQNQTTLDAALKVGAKILPMTLMDYLA